MGYLWYYLKMLCFQVATNSAQSTSTSTALPSAFNRRRSRSSTNVKSTGKVKIYTKDVVCLKKEEGQLVFQIPRGPTRAKLHQLGLIGKVSINNQWDALEVREEISSIFAKAFKLEDGKVLPFTYLR